MNEHQTTVVGEIVHFDLLLRQGVLHVVHPHLQIGGIRFYWRHVPRDLQEAILPLWMMMMQPPDGDDGGEAEHAYSQEILHLVIGQFLRFELVMYPSPRISRNVATWLRDWP